MSATAEGLSFASVDEELNYWKEQAQQYRQELEDLRAEYDDFQENSHDLEAELEASLEQTEAKNKDLQARLQRLEDENDTLKSKLESSTTESYVTISNLQAENAELIQVREVMQKYIREMEQFNDNLERGKRVTMASLDDFDAKLNLALERNAILENELDEKEQLTVMCQRLKDEVRDLRSELEVKVSKFPNEAEEEGQELASSKTAPKKPVFTVPQTPQMKVTLASTPAQQNVAAVPKPITPSTRISALNMVGELLRKTGALEARLASCRSTVNKVSRTTSDTIQPMYGPNIPKNVNGDALQPQAFTKITV